jgi:hypothetical protein
MGLVIGVRLLPAFATAIPSPPRAGSSISAAAAGALLGDAHEREPLCGEERSRTSSRAIGPST